MNPTVNDLVSIFFTVVVIGYVWWLSRSRRSL